MKPAFFLLMSGIRESNPPPRLGKDLRITNALLYQLSHIGNLRINQLKKSTPAGARTLDTLIKSQVLYQLSYGCIISKRKEVSFLLLYTRRGSNPGHPD